MLDHRGDLGVRVGDLRDELLVEHELPHPGARIGDQNLGVRIADQRVVPVRLGGASCGDHDRGSSNAGRDVPAVVVGAQ